MTNYRGKFFIYTWRAKERMEMIKLPVERTGSSLISVPSEKKISFASSLLRKTPFILIIFNCVLWKWMYCVLHRRLLLEKLTIKLAGARSNYYCCQVLVTHNDVQYRINNMRLRSSKKFNVHIFIALQNFVFLLVTNLFLIENLHCYKKDKNTFHNIKF